MSKNSLCGLIAALLIGTIAANHIVPRIRPFVLRIVPVEAFPTTIGDWKAQDDLPIEAGVKEILPHSRFIARLYRDSSGRTAEVLLQSSTDTGEYHRPTVCQPAQGWNVLSAGPTNAGAYASAPTRGPSAYEMQMEMGGQKRVMLYWYTNERALDKWQNLRDRLLSGNTPSRLFVRIIVSADADAAAARRTAHDFASAIQTDLTSLENRG